MAKLSQDLNQLGNISGSVQVVFVSVDYVRIRRT